MKRGYVIKMATMQGVIHLYYIMVIPGQVKQIYYYPGLHLLYITFISLSLSCYALDKKDIPPEMSKSISGGNMIIDIRDYRKNNKLKELNRLVKELLEVRQYLRYFDELNLPDYKAMIEQVPEGVEKELLAKFQQRQAKEFYNYFDLKAREEQLKYEVQRVSKELDKML